MAKQKVRLADNIARVIFVDPDATVGATLGEDVFLPDGEIASPATLREYLGLGGENGLLHSALDGLQVGNDHPQYPMKAAREKVTGQWDFTKAVWGANGTAAAPEFTFTSDTDTGMFRVGANSLGLATGGAQRIEITDSRSHFNISATEFAGIAGLSGIANRVVTLEGMQIVRAAAAPALQMTRVQGTIASPTSVVSGNTLFQFNGYGYVTVAAPDIVQGGSLDFSATENFTSTSAGTNFRVRVAPTGSVTLTNLMVGLINATGDTMRMPTGNAAQPGVAFLLDADTGMYWPGANNVALAAGGVQIVSALLNGTTRTFTLGDGTNGARMNFNRAAGVTSDWAFQSAGVDRWYIRVDSVSEAGSNAGSNLRILRRDDTGAAIADAVRVNRDTGQWLFEDGTAALPELSFSGDTNTGVYRVGADQLGLSTAGTYAASFDASQRLLIGHTAALNGSIGGTSVTPKLQLVSSGAETSQLFARFVNSNAGPFFQFAKSRSGTLGTMTVVQASDVLGRLSFAGADGTDFAEGARIEATVDGTPGSNDMPGRLSLMTTPDGSQDPVERVRIDSVGVLWLLDGVTAPGASVTGMAGIYVDTADGDLKIRFADGTVKTIVTDT